MPSALVTGATGQDGAYLCEQLVRDGYRLHVLVHEHDGQGIESFRTLVPRAVTHTGDIATGAGVADAVAAAEPDEVYNLAGVSSVAMSWREPQLTVDASGFGAMRLLLSVRDWATDHGRAPRFVQASSAEIFGSPVHSPQDESTPVRPVSPYGAAKAFAHHVVGVYRGAGMHASSAILYNHESPRRPETFVTRKITRAVARIARGSTDPLVLGNLEARRDWGWAPDYVNALTLIAHASRPDDYVVATGESHSVADFVAAAFRHVGVANWRHHVRSDPEFVRPADPGELVGDASRLRSLGWRQTVTFDELVGFMVDADLVRLDS